MKKTFNIVFLLLIVPMVFAQSNSFKLYESFQFDITNHGCAERSDAYISISVADVKKLHPGFNQNCCIVYLDEIEIPSQLFQTDNDEEICFVSDFQPDETKLFTVKYYHSGEIDHRYKSRTYAEIAMKVNAEYNGKIFVGNKFEYMKKVEVPSFHTDHNALFKYESAGWESDKVGYRIYADPRNSVDIFGKKIDELVLSEVGAKDLNAKNEKYHELNDWGMDIFKVGKTLGLGTTTMEYNGMLEHVTKRGKTTYEITANGPVKSEITTDYLDWKVGDKSYNLKSKISISAGSRLSKIDLQLDNNPENITTGFAKHEGTEFFNSEGTGDWQYIALYGKQTLANDKLGIALFYKNSNLKKQYEDDLNYLVKLIPDNSKVQYQYAAVWEQEKGGIKSKREFINYCDSVIYELNNPLKIRIK